LFVGINGGPQFPFSEAVSFTVHCEDQDEVDNYWDRLTDGGEESQCGWCKDRFGLSWQIVPDRLYELVSDPHPARAAAATRAMYGMRKIVVAEMEEAADAAIVAYVIASTLASRAPRYSWGIQPGLWWGTLVPKWLI